ncbi:MAG: agmatine deiminase family protein [Bacteroides sp.]|nr:agmatine deiminase family protein [Bacteroides sp.]
MKKEIQTAPPYWETRFPAEWERQSGVQLTWPHAGTDWSHMLEEVEACFVNIAREIARRERLLIVTPHPESVEKRIAGEVDLRRVSFLKCPTNDTWARDHGAITLLSGEHALLLDFKFNGWGLKFPSDKDNLVSRRCVEAAGLQGAYLNRQGFVLEGGSIESDGQGTLLTTSECLLSPNRNGQMSRQEIEDYLCRELHARRILWLDHGYLAGDDTDSHIDTLARFCPADTLAYVACSDPTDEHHEALQRMKAQLETFVTLQGKPYRLLPLPLPAPIREEGERLPATYANFLIINGAVLFPTYRQPHNDEQARRQLQLAFPDREVVGFDCTPLIKQHGSLHCVTMQYPTGVIPGPQP